MSERESERIPPPFLSFFWLSDYLKRKEKRQFYFNLKAIAADGLYYVLSTYTYPPAPFNSISLSL